MPAVRPSLTAQLQQAWLRTQIASANSVSPSADEASRASGPSSSEAHEGKGLSRSSPGFSSADLVDSPSPGSVLWPTFESGSLDGSGFSEAVSSPQSRGNSDSAMEAWEVQEQGGGAVDGKTEDIIDPTEAYFMDLLADQGLGRQRCMLRDCTAYQAMHGELDLIGDVEGLEFSHSPVPGQGWNADVENWVEKLLNSVPIWQEDDLLLPDMSSSAATPEAAINGGAPFSAASPEPGSPQLPSFEKQPVPPSPDGEIVREQESLDGLTRLLLQCAQAVNADDWNTATMLMCELRQITSSSGSALQRVAHYFVEGLLARLSGTGADLFTALNTPGPSAADILRAYQLFVQKVPHTRMAHSFVNSILLDAFEGAERVHIIDYGILYGYQWPSLLQALATRPEGPPKLVRITGIEFPQPGLFPDQRVKETGRRLSQFAAGLHIPFEFKGIADKWDNVHPSSVNLRREEVLAVNCVYRLRHLLDESVLPSSPRRTVLERIRSMEPKVFSTGIISIAGNSPFYMSRLREAITNYATHFEALETTLAQDVEDRDVIESEIYGRDILNITACEGLERIERPEVYSQWQRRILNAGFQQVPLKEGLFQQTREVLRDFHQNFSIGQDENWLLMGWKDTVQHALATWQPKKDT